MLTRFYVSKILYLSRIEVSIKTNKKTFVIKFTWLKPEQIKRGFTSRHIVRSHDYLTHSITSVTSPLRSESRLHFSDATHSHSHCVLHYVFLFSSHSHCVTFIFTTFMSFCSFYKDDYLILD